MRTKLFLIIALSCLLNAYSRAQNQNEMNEKQVTLRDGSVKINYLMQGQGDTTLLFLHGWCINSSYWNNQLDYFKSKFEVCAIDLPGFGKSTAQRDNWTIEEYSKDVLEFIDTMKLKNIIIVGHSMAGEIMLHTALTNNPKIIGIVGVDNFKYIDVEFTPEQSKQFDEFFSMLKNDFKNSAPYYADMMLFHPTTSNDVKDRVKTDFANSDSVIGYETCIKQLQYAYQDAQRLEQLNYKLHLINSDAIPTNETGLKSHCKTGFQVKAISATGHYPMIEKPNEFNRLLEEILSYGIN